MAKLVITKEDKEEFKKTVNGAKKAIWMIVGMIIDFTGTLGICLLNIFANKFSDMLIYYALLFVLLVIIVLGGELIGIYYGALEQYVFHKNNKKVLDSNE
jgi:formate hydrogenlyase subunit 3/multisubunit Na+/H+ antiporter MnhD subunit